MVGCSCEETRRFLVCAIESLPDLYIVLNSEVGKSSIMGHRNFACMAQMFDEDLNQNRSYLHPESRMHHGSASVPENVCFVFPLENEAASGSNPISHSNFSLRLSNCPLSTTPDQQTPGYSATSATSVGPYFPNPSNAAHYMPSSIDYSRAIPSMDNGRGGCKRKSPGISRVYERGSRSEYYSSASSSDYSISSSFQSMGVPNSGPRYFISDCMVSAPPNYNTGRGVPICREGYQRNVRSRSSGSSHHPETSLMETYFSTSTPRYLHTREQPINHTRNGELVGRSSSTTVLEQGPFPAFSGLRGGNLASDDDFNYDCDQLMVQRSINNIPELMGGYHGAIPISSRNSGVTLQDLHASAMQPTRGGRNNYVQRYTAAAYRPLPLPRSGYAASSSEGGLRSGTETYSSSRFSRLARNGDNRVGRSAGRISFDRSRPLSDEEDTHDRLYEGVTVLDHPAYNGYGNLLDQHRDMRLDIENMSYEELLALEERIGNVNTGLSEDFISKSLKMRTYCISDKRKEKIQEEETCCIICQEDYRKDEELGILNCGHDYHAECVKEWLIVKNVCPICKATALPDCISKD